MPKKHGRDFAVAPEEMACRIRMVRQLATGSPTQALMAERVQVSFGQWSNYESGYSRMGLDPLIRYVRALPGMTLDFLVLGEKGGLSHQWVQAIKQYEEEQAVSAACS